ncbi:glycosyltransferase family 87 protein [Cupriavidus sp. TMH.W2]|uniref:glycosyltransferase family 87 protein n=1 Tax=Cupriavidus sp. TMH.W2 TaxID=3434465 RepID=UPI003D787AD2
MSLVTEIPPAPAVSESGPSTCITPTRVRLYAATLLFLEFLLVATWWYGHAVIANPTIPAMGWDFVVYWSASALAQTQDAAAAYDWELLRAAEAPLLDHTFGPFAYPPTFLLLLYPIAAVPFDLALLLASVGGVALYLATVKAAVNEQIVHWHIPALAFPGIWAALLAGQNSLITAAACGGALLLMRRSAIAAGACIAVLCIKPQLGVLFPLLLLCERRWSVIACAAAFSALFLSLTVLCFGTETFTAFVHSLAMFREAVAEHAGSTLRGAPTVFGILRTAGAEVPISYAGHTLCALLAVSICVWIWSTSARIALSASALVACTLLVQPYMIYYDLAWLAIPIALLSVDMARHGSTSAERLLLLLTWLVPAHALLVVLTLPSPQIAPLVLLALLGMIARRHLRTRRAGG